ncbi:MAG: Flp family type IVb pilin [Chloroflexi bacterium]|nr:Flp family type IVb pilin [Chloroflexota bacterium]
MTGPRRSPSAEGGQGLVEYGLIVTLIAIVTLVALLFLSSEISSLLSAIADQI